ncbi:MAG TPA: ribonuclease J [Thermoanaerobaculia bacterium]|nr:ribonuclease J [Thermoanaerobaculia bacterium]
MSDNGLLRIIPLGGLGEIGMNLMVYELADSMIAVDCGMMFPDASTLGVDVVIPDMTYLFDNAAKLSAVFLTHGHEDHIGALPFLADRIRAPVYGMPLTLGFVRDKLEEFGIAKDVELRELRPRELVEAGSFRVEPITVPHSIVDAVAFGIDTPIGKIVHTGDFKFDQTPVDGKRADLARLARWGEEGVLVLVSDSTNAVVAGYTPSERTVGRAFEGIFAQASGRIIVTTFASHIHRIQQIVDLASKRGRVVHFVGRSIVDNVETAERLGHLRIPNTVRPGGRDPDEEPHRTVIVTTGTQGEPTSALARMALNEHRAIQLRQGDTVIISARTIPGNERAVAHVIDHIYRRGANVLYHETSDIHVSGHGAEEELRLMMSLTKPRYFVPMHGTMRHMTLHARLAETMGIAAEDIFVVVNGSVVEIGPAAGRVLDERVPSGKVFIDQQFEEVANVVIRDRQHLAEDGFVIAVLAVDLRTGMLAREPEIITRGFVHVDASTEILDEVRGLLSAMFTEMRAGEPQDTEMIQEKTRALLKRYFRKKLNRRPMILPVIWEM